MKKLTYVVGCAVAALLPVTTAQAQGQLFIANLNGANVVPANTQPFTGTVYAVLDKPETGVTYWFTHNITSVTGGEVRRGAAGQPGTSTKFVFPNPASPGGPFSSTVISPATDSPLMRSGGTFAQFQTAAFPNGVIRGQFVPYLFPVSTTNRVQSRVANVLNASAGQGSDFDGVLVTLARSSAATQTEAFDQLSGRMLYAQNIAILDSFSGLQDSLFAHTAEKGPGAGYFNGFVKGGVSFGKRDDTFDQIGSKVSRPFAIGGINYGSAICDAILSHNVYYVVYHIRWAML